VFYLIFVYRNGRWNRLYFDKHFFFFFLILTKFNDMANKLTTKIDKKTILLIVIRRLKIHEQVGNTISYYIVTK
jgi:hypothetical protein